MSPFKILPHSVCYLILMILAGCKSDRLQVTPSGNLPELSIRRFEQEIFGSTEAGLAKVRERDTLLFDYLVYNYLLPLDRIAEKRSTTEWMQLFVQHPIPRKIYEETQKQYGNLQPVITAWKTALGYFRYHFPDKEIPKLETCISEFGFAVAPDRERKAIVISLDMFLGAHYAGYAAVPDLPMYRLRRMNNQYLVQALVQALYAFHFERPQAPKTFLAAMIEEGKKQYFIDALLPNTNDTIRREYTTEQLHFCHTNQTQLWNYLADNKLFYSSNTSEFYRLMSDGPFTSAPNVPPQAAPRLGVYCGWQIVKHYMDKHPDVSVKAMIENTNYQLLLKESGYKPT